MGNKSCIYFAVINQFMNQEHNVRVQFEEMIRYQSKDIRTIKLPVNLEAPPMTTLDEISGDPGIKEIFITDEIIEKIKQLMFCNNQHVAEQFRIINSHITMASAHSEESLKHRTLLMVCYEP